MAEEILALFSISTFEKYLQNPLRSFPEVHKTFPRVYLEPDSVGPGFVLQEARWALSGWIHTLVTESPRLRCGCFLIWWVPPSSNPL